jgi:hypothetical protein
MKCKEQRWIKDKITMCWQKLTSCFRTLICSVSHDPQRFWHIRAIWFVRFSALSVLCVIDVTMRLWLLHNDMIEKQSLSCISVYLSLFTHYRWFSELVHQMVSFLSLLVFVEHLFINYQDDAAFSKASLCNLSSFHCLVISILESCIDFSHSQVSRCWDQCVWRMFCQKRPETCHSTNRR